MTKRANILETSAVGWLDEEDGRIEATRALHRRRRRRSTKKNSHQPKISPTK